MKEKFRNTMKISLEDLQKDPTLLWGNKNGDEKQSKKAPIQRTTAPLYSKKPQIKSLPEKDSSPVDPAKRGTPLLKASVETLRNTPPEEKLHTVREPVARGEDYRKDNQDIPYELSKEAEDFLNRKKQNTKKDTLQKIVHFADEATIEQISKNTQEGDVFEDDQFTYTVTSQIENGLFHFNKVYKENGTRTPMTLKPETLADKIEQKKLTRVSKPGDTPTTPTATIEPSTPEKGSNPHTKAEESLAQIHDWQNKDISVTEGTDFVTFVFADKKNKHIRDSIMLPVARTEEIQTLKKLIEGAQKPKVPEEKTMNFSKGQTFKTKKGEEYIISNITGTLIHLSGKKQKIESTESLSHLIKEGTLTKVEGEVLLSIGESFYDENGTGLTIKEIKGTLVILTDGKNEYPELKTNIQEYLKSGAFTRVEKTVESLDEQVKALGWDDKDLSYMEEETKEKIIAEQKRKPEQPTTVLTNPEDLKKKLHEKFGWPKDILEMLTHQELIEKNIGLKKDGVPQKYNETTDPPLYAGIIKERKLKKIHSELEIINNRLAEIKKIKEAYYQSQKPQHANTEEILKGEPEKISQPIELSIEDTSNIKTDEKLGTEKGSVSKEKTPALGEYIAFEEIDKNNSPEDALKDIESTTQALQELRIKENHGVAFDILINQRVRYISNFSSEQQLSEAYHKAKKGDTSWSLLNEGNTDNKALIKAVEEALTSNASEQGAEDKK